MKKFAHVVEPGFNTPQKVFVNIHKYDDTSTASVPITQNEEIEGGWIKKGDKIMMVSFGTGFTWGSIIVEF